MKIGMLRAGTSHYALEEIPVFSFTGERICTVSKATPETVRWDLKRHNGVENHYRNFTLKKILSIFSEAGKIFAEGEVEMGNRRLGPYEFARLYTWATGAPIACPLATMKRIKDCFADMHRILAFQAIDGNIEAYSQGYITRSDKRVGWVPRGKNLLVITPANHPAVNVLWSVACAMGYPITIRPSLDDPFTPLRLLNSLIQAGMPSESFSFYPTSHDAVESLVPLYDRSMIFGSEQMVKKYGDRQSTKVLGPGKSVMIVGEEFADDIDTVVKLAFASMTKDGGRGCINLSTIITQKNGAMIAQRLAQEVAAMEICNPLDLSAKIGAYKQQHVAHKINTHIDSSLGRDQDITAQFRHTPRLIQAHGTTFLQPTVILSRECRVTPTGLFGKEFSFPFVTVAEEPDVEAIVRAASGSLVVSLLSHNDALRHKLLFTPEIFKVYQGAITTTDIDFQDPHEGFISNFLFQTKALRMEDPDGCFGG